MLYNTSPDTAFKPTSHIDPLGYGKVAVVTGCGSGIGLATTQLLLAHQFRVCGLDARDFDYQLLRVEDHGRFHFTKADLAAPGACEQAVRVCVAAFGTRIDVLVNVAGVMDNFASADGVTDEDWDRVLTVNLTVPVKMMRGVIPFMTAVSGGRDGAIINVASTAGVSGAVAGVAYTASKHGLIGATKNVAWRFRNEGIRCNAVLPGAVDSSIGKAIAGGVVDEVGFEQVRPVHALQARPTDGAPAINAMEVAKTIVFLLSDQARTINGVSLPVDKAWGVI